MAVLTSTLLVDSFSICRTFFILLSLSWEQRYNTIESGACYTSKYWYVCAYSQHGLDRIILMMGCCHCRASITNMATSLCVLRASFTMKGVSFHQFPSCLFKVLLTFWQVALATAIYIHMTLCISQALLCWKTTTGIHEYFCSHGYHTVQETSSNCTNGYYVMSTPADHCGCIMSMCVYLAIVTPTFEMGSAYLS